MVFRILESVRKHQQTARYAGRHLFWTAPALYGYYTLYGQARWSYDAGYVAVARAVVADCKEARQQRRRRQEGGGGGGGDDDDDCYRRRNRQEAKKLWREDDVGDTQMQVIHRLGACGI